MTSDEWYISDTEEYLSELEKILNIFEKSSLCNDPEVKEMIKVIRESNDVTVHYEYIAKLVKKIPIAQKEE